MSRIVPYPLAMAALVLSWLMITNFSLAQLLLGSIIALGAVNWMAALQPAETRLRRWQLLPKLILIVLFDIIRSNIAVASLILTRGRHGGRQSGFIDIPIDVRHPTALAVLAVVITSTPGTAWIQYDSARGTLLLHVFDLVSEDEWIDLVKNRYEHLLMEIFE